MNPEGTVYNAQGRINRLSVLVVNAYEVALKNGFVGTEEEWLESLKGDPPSEEQIAEAVSDYFKKNHFAIIGDVTLFADQWEKASENLYSQVVTVITEVDNPLDMRKCQVDLTPSVEQLVVFYEKDLTFVTENEDGVVTVYAIGQQPENDYTIQVTLTEVAV